MSNATISAWPPFDAARIARDRWTKPFWDAASQHRLIVQRCSSCGHYRMPPTPFCPQCQSQECEWPRLSGDGTIYSFTVLSPRGDESEASGPLIPALVEFEDAPGIRLVSAIVDAAVEKVHIDAHVRLVWQDEEEGLSAPRFRLV